MDVFNKFSDLWNFLYAARIIQELRIFEQCFDCSAIVLRLLDDAFNS